MSPHATVRLKADPTYISYDGAYVGSGFDKYVGSGFSQTYAITIIAVTVVRSATAWYASMVLSREWVEVTRDFAS